MRSYGDLRLAGRPTAWYAAPEVLEESIYVQHAGKGSSRQHVYWSSADMWAVGCILGELLGEQLLFPSDGSPQDQLRSIARTMVDMQTGKQDPGEHLTHFEAYYRIRNMQVRTKA